MKEAKHSSARGPLILTLRWRQVEYSEFEANLVYLGSFIKASQGYTRRPYLKKGRVINTRIFFCLLCTPPSPL